MLKTLTALAWLVLAAAPAAAAGPGVWNADPVHSSAGFTVTHLGISHVQGVIPIESATIVIPDGSNIPQSAQASFDPAGIDTRNSNRDADLRSAHFFDAATYPKMEFTSTKIAASDAVHFTMTGDLTMHGQAHPIVLDGQYLGRTTTPRGQERAAFTAKTTIDRTQWGMTYGGLVAGNTIDIEIDIEAVLQK
jgi:polyisoprenoid-binding protein YceI